MPGVVSPPYVDSSERSGTGALQDRAKCFGRHEPLDQHHEQAPLSRIFSTRVLVWLGKLSYALYMGHGVVHKVVKIAMPAEKFVAASVLTRLGIFLCYWTALIGTACLLYYLVEIPFRRIMRDFWKQRESKRVFNTPSPFESASR